MKQLHSPWIPACAGMTTCYEGVNNRIGRNEMDDEKKLYRELQLFLDKETLGFPETPSGSDIRLLMALFTPEEAKAVMHLTYKFSTLDEAYGRAVKSAFTREELGSVLDHCAKKGLIAYKKQNGVKYYRTLHYLLGMAEGGLHGGKPKPEFLSAMNQYAKDGLFWKAFLNFPELFIADPWGILLSLQQLRLETQKNSI